MLVQQVFLDGLGNRAIRENNQGTLTMRKTGSELEVGDLIDVGIKRRIGRITGFEAHPRFAELHPGLSARIAITDVGRITVPEQQSIEVFRSL